MDLSPRAVIAGRYRVDTKVGAGGMGEVWLGEQIAIGLRVAIKTLLPAAAMNHEVVARFKREAYILGRIGSDNVAKVVDFVADDLYGLVLVMEFVEGDPLSRMLQERTLTVEEGIDLCCGLASALKDLHAANIIHRDLKPGNIIMAPTPDGRRRAVVVDFGVSRLMSDKDKDEDEELTGITRADMAVGTIEYMAPEQILNSRNVTPGSDIYAAGAMLFRSCAGRHIHGNIASDGALAQKKLTTESPPLPLDRTDKLAEGLARVVGKMVKRRPSERYKSADEVLADILPLRDLARGTTGDADSPTIDAAKGAAVAATVGAAITAPEARTLVDPTRQPGAAPPPAAVAAPTPPPAAVAASAPDSSINVTAPQPAAAAAPPRRGVSPLLTVALVAAALVGGAFLGPRLLQQPGAAQPVANAVAPTAAPTSTAAAPAAPSPAPTASAAAAAPAASAEPSAVPAATAVPVAAPTTTLVPETTPADAGAAALPDAGAVRRVPGPMPRPIPSIPPGLLGPVPPPKVEPTNL